MTAKISLARSLGIAAVLGLSCVPQFAAHAEESAPNASQGSAEVKSVEEKALEQKLSADEPIARGKVGISAGHVDLGPKFVDGQWRLMVHDDSKAEPVWRTLEDVVLVGSDATKLPVPDDARYSFVKASPGSDVYVIPQTEMSGVVWPGWNTQDPEVVAALGRGVTLTLEKVEGPGQMSVYLENGNFSAPQVLWNSDKNEPQDIWVEPNTHAHANWVFTAPGAYFATVRAHATLADGREVSHTQQIKFAIGSETSADHVFAQAETMTPVAEAGSSSHEGHDSAAGSQDSTGSHSTSSASDAAEAKENQGVSPALIAGIILAVAVIGGGVAFMMRKSSKAQREAMEKLK